MRPTYFNDLLAFDQLPWFQVAGDQLILDPDVGPVIDIHTHLSLAFVLPSSVCQRRVTDEIKTYLPERVRAIDLEPYGNTNLTSGDLSRMKRDLTLGNFHPFGMRQTHTAANLLRRMSDMQITHAVILAVDLPVISSNSERYIAISRQEPRLIPFGSSHPSSPMSQRRVKRLARLGARGLKVHPASQYFYPNAPRAMAVYGACGEAGIPVFWHCGPVGIELEKSRKMSQVRFYEEPIATFPEVTFFLGHSGALQYEEAIALARRYPNTVMDLSSQGLTAVRAIIEGVDHDRIVNGSDWPFYHQALGIARVLLATEGDGELRRKILHDNAARLLWLRTHQRRTNNEEE